MTNSANRKKLTRMTQLSILIAVMAIFFFTPLGYLKTAGLEISFMMIPVVIGAIVLGPTAGAILGGVFGITSFIQCFGTSPFGAALLAINPFYTFLVCMVSRILAGYLSGVIFNALRKIDKTKLLSFGAASLSGALMNTVFFMTLLMLFFSQTDFIKNLQGEMNILPFVIAFVGLQGLLEAVLCFIAGTAISKALVHFIKKA